MRPSSTTSIRLSSSTRGRDFPLDHRYDDRMPPPRPTTKGIAALEHRYLDASPASSTTARPRDESPGMCLYGRAWPSKLRLADYLCP